MSALYFNKPLLSLWFQKLSKYLLVHTYLKRQILNDFLIYHITLSGPNLPTKQYNSPKNMYSDDAIREIMVQQAEILEGGVKG